MKKTFLLLPFLFIGNQLFAGTNIAPYKPAIVITQADTTGYAAYQGKYLFEGLPFEYIEIKKEHDKLMISAGSQAGELTKLAGTDQFDAAGQAVVTFTRNANNKIVGAILDAQGQQFDGIKEGSKLEAYVGKYKLTGLPFDYIEISLNSGKLHYQAGQYQGDLSSLATPDKFDASGRAEVSFLRNGKNEVSSISINVQGEDYAGVKETAPGIKEYVGKYKMDGLPFEFTEVKAMDGKLFYIAGEYNGELVPKNGTDKFDADGTPVSFVRDASGKITSFKANIEGSEYEGKK